MPRSLIKFLSVVARNVPTLQLHMFLTGEVWNPVDLASVETPVEDRIKYTKNNFNQSFKQLLSLGLTSNELIDLINNLNFSYYIILYKNKNLYKDCSIYLTNTN